MRVTIIADASHCPETNAAGYGFWVACDRGKFGSGGSMKERVASEPKKVCEQRELSSEDR